VADDALQAEFERSRESSVRLLENLASKIGAKRAVQSAAGGVHRAARYVQAHSVKDMATGIEQVVRRRPAYSIATAVLAGYLLGCVLRPVRRESIHGE
jgi:ElaB/YqjD/DUF883 family membrane-anchored ribosome-binding protein